MEASNPLREPNSPELVSHLVLGIHPGLHATGLALRNPKARPQLTWAAILAPQGDETLGDYADRITALAATVRGLRDVPTPVHLAGRPTGYILGPGSTAVGLDDGELRRLTDAIALSLDPPVIEIPCGDYHHLLDARLPSPIQDGGWPTKGFGPCEHDDLTPVAVAAVLTRWTPYPPPLPLRHLDEVGTLGRVAPLSGHEARSAPEGDAPRPGLPASPSTGPLASVSDGRR